MSFENIPLELRQLRQWVCWKYSDIGAAKPTKLPINPLTSQMASVDNPDTWASFEEACYASTFLNGIGFVFTTYDPYSGIDLDNPGSDAFALTRQIEIHKEFDSYSEVSPSGKGLHIIVKGKIPAGRRRGFIEVYSSLRYLTFTGNVYNAKSIEDRQEQITKLWESLGGAPTTELFTGDAEQHYKDAEIIEQAKHAFNGEKFTSLFDGKWQSLYGSQSEADFALIDIVAFYSRNRNQISRIFRNSQLGKREKANRQDYVNGMIKRSFDQMLPKVDIDGFKNVIEEKIAAQAAQPKENEPVADTSRSLAFDSSTPSASPKVKIPLPPGLMGELAQYIYASAPRPVEEIALAGAIGLMSGICGRAYNISNSGLNLYILLLAQTGTGKEAIATGISSLMMSVKAFCPVALEFLGPSEIASGQALVRYFSETKSKSIVSVLDEFGLRMEDMSGKNIKDNHRTLKRVLLEIYHKSGKSQIYSPSIYADKDRNTHSVLAPSFTIIGTSTPSTLYNALTEEMITEGLLPRFSIIEYLGPRPPYNENHVNIKPQEWLMSKIATLCELCMKKMDANDVYEVKLSDEAEQLARDFNAYCDNEINSSEDEANRQLWNRAHIKVLRIAALLAVGVNPHFTIIEPSHMMWAINLVRNDIRLLHGKFERGEIGTNSSEMEQGLELAKAVKNYMRPWEKVKSYTNKQEKEQKLHFDKIITWTYLSKVLTPRAAFRKDDIGQARAIERTVKTFIDSGRLQEVAKHEMIKKYGATMRAFVVSDMSILD